MRGRSSGGCDRLSFIEQGPQGLFPHDLVREALDRDLRWRNPDDYHDLHDRIRAYVVQRLMSTTGIEQQRAFFDLLYLHRTNPIVRPIYRWSTLGTAWAEPAVPDDHAAILAAVRRHEGDASARIATHWLERQPGAFTVFRRAGEPVAGFIASIALHAATAEDLEVDPVARAADAFARRSAPARPGDVLLLHRYAIDCEQYQAYDGLWEMFCMQSGTQWLTTPRLAWAFIVTADPNRDLPFMTYHRFQRSQEAETVVGERSYGVFTHDWRVEPPLVWLDVMHARELAREPHIEPLGAPGPTPFIVLSRTDFDEAVRQALRDYHRADALAANPLSRSRLVVDQDQRDPAVAIRHLLDHAIAILRDSPRDERLYRAIARTYLHPAASQELAAEALGLPFSTYRYHLTHGIKRVAEWLWQRDVAGGGMADG